MKYPNFPPLLKEYYGDKIQDNQGYYPLGKLGDDLGINKSSISTIYHGKSAANPFHFQSIKDKLNLPHETWDLWKKAILKDYLISKPREDIDYSNAEYTHLAPLLKKYREEKELETGLPMSLKEFGKQLGFSESQFSRIYSGKSYITIEHFESIEKDLDIDYNTKNIWKNAIKQDRPSSISTSNLPPICEKFPKLIQNLYLAQKIVSPEYTKQDLARDTNMSISDMERVVRGDLPAKEENIIGSIAWNSISDLEKKQWIRAIKKDQSSYNDRADNKKTNEYRRAFLKDKPRLGDLLTEYVQSGGRHFTEFFVDVLMPSWELNTVRDVTNITGVSGPGLKAWKKYEEERKSSLDPQNYPKHKTTDKTVSRFCYDPIIGCDDKYQETMIYFLAYGKEFNPKISDLYSSIRDNDNLGLEEKQYSLFMVINNSFGLTNKSASELVDNLSYRHFRRLNNKALGKEKESWWFSRKKIDVPYQYATEVLALEAKIYGIPSSKEFSKELGYFLLCGESYKSPDKVIDGYIKGELDLKRFLYNIEEVTGINPSERKQLIIGSLPKSFKEDRANIIMDLYGFNESHPVRKEVLFKKLTDPSRSYSYQQFFDERLAIARISETDLKFSSHEVNSERNLNIINLIREYNLTDTRIGKLELDTIKELDSFGLFSTKDLVSNKSGIDTLAEYLSNLKGDKLSFASIAIYSVLKTFNSGSPERDAYSSLGVTTKLNQVKAMSINFAVLNKNLELGYDDYFLGALKDIRKIFENDKYDKKYNTLDINKIIGGTIKYSFMNVRSGYFKREQKEMKMSKLANPDYNDNEGYIFVDSNNSNPSSNLDGIKTEENIIQLINQLPLNKKQIDILLLEYTDDSNLGLREKSKKLGISTADYKNEMLEMQQILREEEPESLNSLLQALNEMKENSQINPFKLTRQQRLIE